MLKQRVRRASRARPDAQRTAVKRARFLPIVAALGVLVALLRRADEGGSWLVRVALAKTAMLGTRFAENHEPAVAGGHARRASHPARRGAR